MKHLSLFVTVSALALLCACGGTEKTSATPSDNGATGNAVANANNGLVQACKAAMTKARTCTDEYLPALVDLRIELDVPAGIAAAAQSQGRDALIAKAQEEWQNDSTDAAIDATCQNMTTRLPAEHQDKVTTTSNECAAKDACGDFVACTMPMHREMFQMAAAMKKGQ